MCGIVGVIAFSENSVPLLSEIDKGVRALDQRGPDSHSSIVIGKTALGHARLSVIDPRPEGAQPMSDHSGRYTITFNGEFYNYRELRAELESKGYRFRTNTDTEVILVLYIVYGEAFLDKLNGCFAFAIHDKSENTTIIVRDRFGIKPLVYWHCDEHLIFSSEIKGISAIKKPKTINHKAVTTYFQLNYIPHPDTIYAEIKKLPPGHLIAVKGKNVEVRQYFSAGDAPEPFCGNYSKAKELLLEKLDAAVQRRLVADVPLGCFLSGGIDSSAVSALASRHKHGLQTFSVGYADNPFFDETEYANLVAQKFNTNHTVFSLTNKDLLDHVFQVLDYFDEPFADSSALPVFILSRRTKQNVTVSLSGDAADEIFAGYNKHSAFSSILQNRNKTALLKFLQPILAMLPQSRNSGLGNASRKASKYLEVSQLNNTDLYWRLCSIWRKNETEQLLKKTVFSKTEYLHTESPANLNQSLLNDVQLVLANDMLHKVDAMSMANGLEVRVPFLDIDVFKFGFSLPDHFKLSGNFKKKILQDTFKDILPQELYKRPKHGFEVPLLDWLRTELSGTIDRYLNRDLIEEQGIFHFQEIQNIRKQLNSISPADATAKIWALLGFQHWWLHKFRP